MDAWLALASSADGQEQLRAVADTAAPAGKAPCSARRDDVYGRLLMAIGPDEALTEVLADLAVTCPGDVTLQNVQALIDRWGQPRTPAAATLLSVLQAEEGAHQ
jgi:hypothetical protein